MLFNGSGSVRTVKSRQAVSRPRSQFFTIRASSRQIKYIYFKKTPKMWPIMRQSRLQGDTGSCGVLPCVIIRHVHCIVRYFVLDLSKFTKKLLLLN